MKNPIMKNQLTAILSGICLLIPIAYAEPDFNNPSSIEQVEATPHNRGTETNSFNKNDGVLITQFGDNNYAIVDVNGNNNQLSLSQKGNNNEGDIQINGDSNKLSALQNGDTLSFGLKIDGDNRAYTLTQEKH
jgi:hypothetical protein